MVLKTNNVTPLQDDAIVGETDESILERAAELQDDTKAALTRIQQQAVDAETVGTMTLAELAEQREQLQSIQGEADRIQEKLKMSEKLQNKMSFWGLVFNRRAARRAAEKEILHQKKRKELQNKRKESMAAIAEAADESCSKDAIEIVVHKKRKNKGRKDQIRPFLLNSNNDPHAEGALLYSIELEGLPDDELEALAQADAEIEAELEAVEKHLDNLLRMSKTINGEMLAQRLGLEEYKHQMEEVEMLQKVVNNRQGRYLDGAARKKHEKEMVKSATGYW